MKSLLVVELFLQIMYYIPATHTLILKATCDNTMYFYIDGVLLPTPNKGDWTKIDTVTLDANHTSNIFGIKCVNSGGPGAIIMSTDDGRVSNTVDWKCTNQEVPGWLNSTFDDSGWQTPTDFGKLGAQIWSSVNGIDPNAHWIWTSGGSINSPTDRTVWCRTNITVHGKWSQWTSWSSCSEPCATGNQTRTRTCSDPAPAYGGHDCEGTSDSPQLQLCNTHFCPIHGNWGAWSAVGSCDCLAGNTTGVQTYSRECNDPTPMHLGNNCSTSIDDDTKTMNDCSCEIETTTSDDNRISTAEAVTDSQDIGGFEHQNQGQSSAAAAIGASVTAVAALAGVGACAGILLFRRRKQKKEEEEKGEEDVDQMTNGMGGYGEAAYNGHAPSKITMTPVS